MTIYDFQERLDKAKRDGERISLSVHQMNIKIIDEVALEDIGYSWTHVLSMHIMPYSVHFRIINDKGYLYIENGFTDQVSDSEKYTIENGVRRYSFFGW